MRLLARIMPSLRDPGCVPGGNICALRRRDSPIHWNGWRAEVRRYECNGTA